MSIHAIDDIMPLRW